MRGQAHTLIVRAVTNIGGEKFVPLTITIPPKARAYYENEVFNTFKTSFPLENYLIFVTFFI